MLNNNGKDSLSWYDRRYHASGFEEAKNINEERAAAAEAAAFADEAAEAEDSTAENEAAEEA